VASPASHPVPPPFPEPTSPWNEEPLDTASCTPPPAAIAASPVKFCRECGLPWDPAWSECQACVSRLSKAAAVETDYAHDVRRIKSAVALYFALLAVSLVFMIYLLATEREPGVQADLVVSGAMSGIVLIWCAASWRQVLPTLGKLSNPLWYLLGAAAAVPTYLLASAVVKGIESFGVQSVRYTDPFFREGHGFAMVVLVVCVQPAIFEELAFRGVIQSSLQLVMGTVSAIFVSALMFGVLHLSMPSMPHLVTIGLVLAWMRAKTGSLYPGMLMHFTHNLLIISSERWGGIFPW
jgi:uncharacterized protein